MAGEEAVVNSVVSPAGTVAKADGEVTASLLARSGSVSVLAGIYPIAATGDL